MGKSAKRGKQREHDKGGKGSHARAKRAADLDALLDEFTSAVSGLVTRVETDVRRVVLTIEESGERIDALGSSFELIHNELRTSMESNARSLDAYCRELTVDLDDIVGTTHTHSRETLAATHDRIEQDSAAFGRAVAVLRDSIEDEYTSFRQALAATHDRIEDDYTSFERDVELERKRLVHCADSLATDGPVTEPDSLPQLTWSPVNVRAPSENHTDRGSVVPDDDTPDATDEADWFSSVSDDLPNDVVPDSDARPQPVFDTDAPWSLPTHTVARPTAGARPVTVSLTVAALGASIEVLTRGDPHDAIGISVVPTAHNGATGSHLRLTVWNVGGWWEIHELPVDALRLESEGAVVNLHDVRTAVEAAERYTTETSVTITIADDVTIGNTLCLARECEQRLAVRNPKFVEHVELQRAWQGDVTIETQLGPLTVPSRLATLLRSRFSATTSLVVSDLGPCLLASLPGPTEAVVATIIAPLTSEDGANALAPERRQALDGVVTQLLHSLSADTTPEELAQVVRTGVGYARRLAAAHPNLPPELIAELMRDGTEAIRAAAASNPGIDDEVWDLASGDPSPLVRSAVAANPAIDLGRLTHLSLDPSPHVRVGVATNAAAVPELLRLLARDPDAAVRAAVAANPTTEVATLELLAHDADPVVCDAVARNRACPAASLEELVVVVPLAVMANPRTPDALLAAGSRVNDRKLRLAVAGNPATPSSRLDALARFEDPELLRVLADNPSTPRGTRRRLRRRLDAASA